MFLDAVPVFAALSQQGLSPMLNPRAAMDDYLEAFDITDKDRYYTTKAALPPGQPQQAAQPEQAAGTFGANGGITSPLATAPSSPSNPESMSPEVFMQQALAKLGGPVNE